LRRDEHSYTPDLLRRIVTRAGRLHSFAMAAVALEVAADLSISGRHIQRLTQEVGADLARQRDDQAARYRRRERKPRVPESPPLAVVEVDGGRLGTRQTGAGPGVHQLQATEDKIAGLVSMRSQRHDTDPQPQPPASFRDARRVARRVQQFQAHAAPPAETPAAPPEEPETAAALDRPGKPERLVRTCVATMQSSRAFGPLVAAAAQARAFYDAPRQAFVGDGQQYNGQIQRAWFPHFVAISDFLHVLCYLYRAAWAVAADDPARGRQFEAWMTACWQGRVGTVLEELGTWQQRLGRPPPEMEPDAGDARQVLAEVVGYLRHNQPRMDYPRYRREGLPVTSSLVESLAGEFNSPVKGKSWNRSAGAEAILQAAGGRLIRRGSAGTLLRGAPRQPVSPAPTSVGVTRSVAKENKPGPALSASRGGPCCSCFPGIPWVGLSNAQ
jgi:hypothetical protein